MYKYHPAFESPEDENTEIWRYLDFTKFVSLLEKQALFFTTVTAVNDKFEGLYSEATIKRLRNSGTKHSERLLSYILELETMKESVLINSWHLNKHESEAMWKLYLKSDEGIAIQSTFNRLADSFNNFLEDAVNIGMVNYIDYRSESIPIFTIDALDPFVYKRKFFEHEQELRALIGWPYISESREERDSFQEDRLVIGGECKEWIDSHGAYVPVNLEVLIEKIVVSPTAPQWFTDLVKSIVDKYELNKKVIPSSLADDPSYQKLLS